MQDLIERHQQYTTDEVDDWETWKSDVFFKQNGFYMDRKLGATMNGKPMFQWLLDLGRVKQLCDTANHIAFIPAGFNKAKNDDLKDDKLLDTELASLNGINPVQHRLAGGSALMSLLHVLVIPKLEYKRVFNAVTLPGKDYDLADAIKCGEEALKKLKKGGVDEVGSLKFWLQQKGNLAVREADLSAEKGTVLPETAENHVMDIRHSFHVYGNNSVGYLHMHVYDGSLLTKAYDEMKGDSKNTPVHVVRKWVEEKKKQTAPKRETYDRTKHIVQRVSVHPAYETPPALASKANAHPRFKNLRH
jgi:hypothetical protein